MTVDRRRSVVLTVLAATALLVPSARPALAAPAAGAAAGPRALTVTFEGDPVKGTLLVEGHADQPFHLTTALGGLDAGSRYRIVGSSTTCAKQSLAGKRTLVATITADPFGGSFRGVVDAGDYAFWRETKTVRLMEEEGIFYFLRSCGRVSHLFEPTGGSADGVYARFADGSRRGLTVNTGSGNDQLRMRLALTGLGPGTRYRLVLSPLTCQQALEGDPDQPIVVGSFKANADGRAFRNRTETVDNNESITVHSSRVERLGGQIWSCHKAVPFGVTAG